MRWIARIFVFTVALTWGACAVSLFGDLRGSGLSDCVVELGPRPVPFSQPPTGVHIMYAGWSPESDDAQATLRFIVHNGLDVPVIYRAATPRDAMVEAWIGGMKFEKWTCENGIYDYQIAPGATAEILATRWDFPRDLAANARATVGLNLYLTPHPASLTTNPPDILAITEPFTIPKDIRTIRRP